MGHVALHGLLAERQGPCDLPVLLAAQKQPDDLVLADAELRALRGLLPAPLFTARQLITLRGEASSDVDLAPARGFADGFDQFIGEAAP